MRGVNVERLLAHFPFREPRATQRQALETVAASTRAGGAILEIPTGEGKTAIGIAALRAVQGRGGRFYVTPTKVQAEQIAREFPDDVHLMYGRGEYPCDYYTDRGVPGITAQESPCYLLQCPHRVDQETGETVEPGATPCQYFLAKFRARERARNGEGTTVCTTAFFLKNRLLVPEWRDEDPALVVLDEVHGVAKTARSSFEYTVTDYYVRRAIEILKLIDKEQAVILQRFIRSFRAIARRRPARVQEILREEEIERLIAILNQLDADRIERVMRDAIADGRLDSVEQRREIKELENLSRNIPRFVRSLSYSIEDADRKPLNYVVAFYYRQDDPLIQGTRRQARYFLTIRPYHVRPFIQRAVGKNVVGYSATIGNPTILRFETGLEQPFWSAGSSFSSGRTRVYLPKDTPNLSRKVRRRNDVRNALRLIAATAAQFAQSGQRSLVVVVSNEERERFLRIVEQRYPTLEVVSYNTNGVSARAAAAAFVGGRGDVLIGTVAQYAEGIDLPAGLAPVIFFLRPGYQRPDDPMTQFEERRFSEGHCWALWNWRVMIEALQVRGRNIRSRGDVGVCFFVSQQFRRFLYPALPEWLRPAYVGDKTMEACVRDAMTLLSL